MAGDHHLTIKNVSLLYRRQTRPAIQIDSLTIPPGRTLLLGPNGAGKTSLLRMLAGELPLGRQGRVTLTGTSYAQVGWKPTSDVVGYLPQNPRLPAAMTVHGFLELAAWLSGVSAEQTPVQVDTWLDYVGLSSRRNSRCNELSGGMQRRLQIAATMICEPPIVLLDEPANGLDPEQRVQLRELLGSFPASTICLVSTHLIEDVTLLADHVVVLDHGQVAFSGTTNAFLSLAPAGKASQQVAELAYLTVRSGTSP